MSGRSLTLSTLGKACVVIALTGSLAGCWSNYLANHDGVAFGAGNAVRANLEASTVNPSSDERYDVDNLGTRGDQMPDDAAI